MLCSINYDTSNMWKKSYVACLLLFWSLNYLHLQNGWTYVHFLTLRRHLCRVWPVYQYHMEQNVSDIGCVWGKSGLPSFCKKNAVFWILPNAHFAKFWKIRRILVTHHASVCFCTIVWSKWVISVVTRAMHSWSLFWSRAAMNSHA